MKCVILEQLFWWIHHQWLIHQTPVAAFVGFRTVYSQAMDALHLPLYQFHQNPTTRRVTFLENVDWFLVDSGGFLVKCIYRELGLIKFNSNVSMKRIITCICKIAGDKSLKVNNGCVLSIDAPSSALEATCIWKCLILKNIDYASIICSQQISRKSEDNTRLCN